MKDFLIIIVLILFGSQQIKSTPTITYCDLNYSDGFYLFYGKEKVKDLSFRFILSSGVDEKEVYDYFKNLSFIKTIKKQSASGDTLKLKLSFSKQPQADVFRIVLQELGLSYFRVNGQKIYVKNLITVEEAFAENAAYSPENMPFKSEYNDPNMPEFYDYQLYRYKTKMKHMQTSEYPRYLYQGYVTKHQDLIDNAMLDKEEYYKNK